MLLTEEQQYEERLRAMCRTYERADTTLAGFKVTVDLVDQRHIQTPGFSTNAQINLNRPYIGRVSTKDDMIKVTGVNFHEFAHVILTPPNHAFPVTSIIAENMFSSFNALEDQRIETFVAAKYSSLRPYFTTMIMEYVAGMDENNWDTVHALTHGRRYLPASIREQFRLRYKHQNDLRELEAIIDAYRKVVFPRDAAVALDLVRRYHKLLRDQLPPLPHGHGESNRSTGGVSSAQSEQAQQSGAEAAEEKDAEGWGDGDGSGSKTDQKSDKDGKGEGESGGEGDGDGDQPGGDGAGKGRDKMPPGEFRKQLQDEAKSAKEAPQVKADITRVEQEMKHRSGELPNLDLAKYTEHKPDLPYERAMLGMKKELMKLWADADPGWKTYKSSGRINIGRAMRGGELDTLWDQWDEGVLDATSLEVVLLVDFSGTMHRRMDHVSQSLWAIKKAVESVGGEVTVLGFAGNSLTFYSKKDKATDKYRGFGAGGNTYVAEAADQARLIMHYSEKSHRIVFILTDGSWGDTLHGNTMVEAMQEHGIYTALAYMSDDVSGEVPEYHRHKCQTAVVCNNPLQLIGLVREVVTANMGVQK